MLMLGLTASCANQLSVGFEPTGRPTAREVRPSGSYLYESILTTRAAAITHASQVFSYQSDVQWTSIIVQDGASTCQARVEDVFWTMDGEDCISGALWVWDASARPDRCTFSHSLNR